MSEIDQDLRLLEALIFASAAPVDETAMRARLPEDVDLPALLAQLAADYAMRGVNLVQVAGKWSFHSAPDLGAKLKLERPVTRKLSRAGVETLAIIAYHQPVTRAEIEEIRGVGLSKGTLETLMETGWVRTGRRRRSPGRPMTWITTEAFLEHFALTNLDELPGIDELKAAGLMERRPTITEVGALGDKPLEAAEEEQDDEADDTVVDFEPEVAELRSENS